MNGEKLDSGRSRWGGNHSRSCPGKRIGYMKATCIQMQETLITLRGSGIRLLNGSKKALSPSGRESKVYFLRGGMAPGSPLHSMLLSAALP